ncbi:hypothetical protein XH97_32035 [Bradyrhizobium sp. CCBAU 53380]|nr:hypothetical protein [Bradyrhizobium sp. CCBAU 53380]
MSHDKSLLYRQTPLVEFSGLFLIVLIPRLTLPQSCLQITDNFMDEPGRKRVCRFLLQRLESRQLRQGHFV